MKTLKFHKNKELPLHGLPFVGGKQKDGLGLNFFDVPATGGYSGGNTTGSALAWLWLKHIETNGAEPFSSLGLVIRDMTEVEDESRYGQLVGFMDVIGRVISKLIADYKVHFTQDEVELLAKANAGLNYVEKEPEYADD
ncbi:hypothetical protein CIG19_18830 [Enterobacterales bacterium CwR94]|nr:hypothetical protein CIG19_18830 [Enterobacterales bacterium CwR94]